MLKPSDQVTALQVTALILAGGQSSRMGTDKALTLWQGVPLLQRVVEVAQQCCGAVSILTPWPERYQDLVFGPTHAGSIQWLMESAQNMGPMGAFAQGLEAITTPWVLLLACDLPQLDPSILLAWMNQLPVQRSASTAIAYVPYHQSWWEPLCGLYHRDCRAGLEAFLSEGGRSFQKWLSQQAVISLAVDEAIAPMLQNCNSPQDLTSFRNGSQG